jgi:hypothetical protein
MACFSHASNQKSRGTQPLCSFTCQRKIEMSYSLQSRNVLFSLGGARARGNLGVPVKRRRAMLASNPIEE